MLFDGPRAAQPDALVLVAPAVSMASDLVRPEIPSLVVLADEDRFVDVEQTRNWFGDDAVIETMETDHFFFGQHELLGERVGQRLAELIRVSGRAWN